ncbi:hypothetical protein Hanom_Chr09g00852681 [Helianthus anomalus]
MFSRNTKFLWAILLYEVGMSGVDSLKTFMLISYDLNRVVDWNSGCEMRRFRFMCVLLRIVL